MKKIIVVLFLASLFYGTLFAEPTPLGLTQPIRIVHPTEGAQLPAVSSTFVYGSVPPNGKLLLNGNPVPIHPSGGFLAMINLAPGEFQIRAEYQLGDKTYPMTRTIYVARPEQSAPVSPVTIEYVTPRQNQELLPGDAIEVVCKGSPGAKASFSIPGIERNFPMTETDEMPGGIYHGIYQIGSNDPLKNSRVKVTLINQNNEKVSKESEGTLSLFPNDPPLILEVTSPDGILYAGPALPSNEKAGYLMFPPMGTVLRATGMKGDEYRIRLSNNTTAWIDAREVKRLPEGTLPTRTVVGTITINATERATNIRIPLRRKIPFKVDTDGNGNYVDLTLYGAYSNTDWINNAASGVIQGIRWHQDNEETYRLRIDTVQNGWWGFDARYEGKELVLELRTPPPVEIGNSPLAGLTIAIDPGHSADSGAIGPTGFMEKDANLAQALVLKEKLTAKGAIVFMTRESNEDVPLRARPKKAWEKRADLLISIHNNALNYGGNPFIRNGFGVYYSTPMSLPLAKEIHAAYHEAFRSSKEFKLRDDGLYYGNLALTRSPQMPSVLVESAYMIVPEEEIYLKNPAFHGLCADAIVSGLERYVRQMRPVKR